MLQFQSRKTKITALLTSGVLMASALACGTAPAQADTSKEKLYKGGAVALGVLGGYWILKGKTLPGAAAAAGAYYAYKKGQKENDRDNRYDNRNSNRDVYPDSRYSRNDRYPDYGYSRIAPASRSNGRIVLK